MTSLITIKKQSNYTVEKTLGTGTFAWVQLVKQNETLKKFAAKVFAKNPLQSDEFLFQRKILSNEIYALSQLKHKTISAFYECFETPTQIIIILEYIKGRTLQSLISKQTQFTENQIAHIIKVLVEGLAYLELKGILHRDLNPNNIIFDDSLQEGREETPQIKIIDFGLAIKQEDTFQFRDASIHCGTPGFVAPEIFTANSTNDYTNKVDIFSVGAIFYELLAQKPLFIPKPSMSVFEANKKGKFSLKYIKSQINNDTFELLSGMLEVNPHKR